MNDNKPAGRDPKTDRTARGGGLHRGEPTKPETSQLSSRQAVYKDLTEQSQDAARNGDSEQSTPKPPEP